MDVPLFGYPYTGACSHGKPDAVEERLDRAMATSTWLSLYPNVQLKNGFGTYYFAYWDTVISLRQWMFKFENKWLHEEGLCDVVEEGRYEIDSSFMADKVASYYNRHDLALKFRKQVQDSKDI